MKNLFSLLLLVTLVALGGVFFEVWKIPQLEKFPTISRYSKAPVPSLEDSARKRMNQDADQAPPGGPLAPKRSESIRDKQLKEAREKLTP